jgi:uncharacterized protein (TIGR02453 family)
VPVMGFAGFGEQLVDFYDGLEADNSKAYWTDNKAVYDEQVKAPMTALLAALEPEFGRGKIFRPYRDVRFSADKTPYKTHCGATVGGYYVQAGADGIMIAGGYYQMAGDQIARYRVAVDEERRGEDLRRRLGKVAKAGLTVAGDQLATRPRGVDPGHPRLELLRHRSLYAWRRWPGEDLMLSPELTGEVAAHWRTLNPLIEWLADHVGPTERPRR